MTFLGEADIVQCFVFSLQLESQRMSALIISFNRAKSITKWRIVGRRMCTLVMTTDKLCHIITRPAKVHRFSITNLVLFFRGLSIDSHTLQD